VPVTVPAAGAAAFAVGLPTAPPAGPQRGQPDEGPAGPPALLPNGRVAALAESEGGVQRHPVVLMHNQPAGNPATVRALPVIIRFFRSRGYRFVNVLGGTGVGYLVLTAHGGVRGFGPDAPARFRPRFRPGSRPRYGAAVAVAANPATGGTGS